MREGFRSIYVDKIPVDAYPPDLQCNGCLEDLHPIGARGTPDVHCQTFGVSTVTGPSFGLIVFFGTISTIEDEGDPSLLAEIIQEVKKVLIHVFNGAGRIASLEFFGLKILTCLHGIQNRFEFSC